MGSKTVPETTTETDAEAVPETTTETGAETGAETSTFQRTCLPLPVFRSPWSAPSTS